MAETYITGAVVRMSAAFSSSGTPVDPATVTALVKLPDETINTYDYPTSTELVRDGIGEYHLDVATTLDGTHRVRFASTGAGAAAAEVSFFAKSSFI